MGLWGGMGPGEEVRGNGEQVGDEGAGVFAALGTLARVSLGRWVRSRNFIPFVFFLPRLLHLLLLLLHFEILLFVIIFPLHSNCSHGDRSRKDS